ncbi:phosphomannomutase/phosphoglucomutase [Bordetella pertussis]|uniref:phosphomannomutase/phosphoglucomutase n=1 Tax=Bordetella pertussis TaxID=520 RepID=UPI0009B2D8D6|nr:phosphomannomutase/phosphoglucomutase [Bordetella pertussis]
MDTPTMHGSFDWDGSRTGAGVFGPYDIRGRTGEEIDAGFAHALGLTLGRRAVATHAGAVVIGRDATLSSVALAAALQAGIRAAGTHVIDIGRVTTPMMYYATRLTETGAGVAVTGRRDGQAHSSFKIMMHGAALYGAGLGELREAMIEADGAVDAAESPGARRQLAVLPCYQARLLSDIRLRRPLKVALDCGHGVTSLYAPDLLRELGCEVTALFADGDPGPADHPANPGDPRNLQDLIYCLRYSDCEVGLAFDGDGDRLAVVSKSGEIIWADRLLVLLARDVLARRPGASVIYDVKCGRLAPRGIEQAGGEPLIWKSGPGQIKARMQETGALLAGEMSGRLYFKDRWYGFDDAIYAAARVLELLSGVADATALLTQAPASFTAPETRVALPEADLQAILAAMQVRGGFPGARRITYLDGVRVDYDDGFGLVRQACGAAVLALRFEGDTAAALARIQAEFRRELARIASHLSITF